MLKQNKNIRKISKIPSGCRERYLPLDHFSAGVLKGQGVFFAGISELCSGYQVGLDKPSADHMVIITHAGEGYLVTEEREYQLKGGSLLVVPAGYRYLFGVEDDYWEISWFYLRDYALWQELKLRGICLSEYSLATDRVRVLMEWLLEDVDSNKLKAELDCGLLFQSIKEVLGVFDERFDERTTGLIELMNKVKMSLDETWTLERMARELFVSPATLQREIRKFYGMTGHQLMIKLKMELASKLLENTDYPLKVIAQRLAYSDEFVFSSAFKKYYGCAPGFFRRKN
jgi:AraC-like DNA-binding protein